MVNRIMQRSMLGLSLMTLITACSPDSIVLAGSSSASAEKDSKLAKRGNISTGVVRPGESNPELDSTTELLGSDSASQAQAGGSSDSQNVRLPENVSGAFLVGCSSIVPADGSVPMVTCGVESGDGAATIVSVTAIRVKSADAESEDDEESSSWVSVDMDEMSYTESSLSFPMAIELLDETKIEVSAEVRIISPSGKQMVKHMILKRQAKQNGKGRPPKGSNGSYKKADFQSGNLSDFG
jgi:hypothetical protein